MLRKILNWLKPKPIKYPCEHVKDYCNKVYYLGKHAKTGWPLTEKIIDQYQQVCRTCKIVLKPEITQPNRTILEPKEKPNTKPKPSYFCDVCKQPAKHIAMVESDTGRHVIGAKCDEHIGMVIRQMQDEKFTGTRIKSPEAVHFAGFKSEQYSEWFECSCPKNTTHYILSDDSRVLPKE